MKRTLSKLLCIILLFVSCQKDSINKEEDLWEIKSCKIEYFDNDDNKVFEESPAELKKFQTIRLYKDGFTIIESQKSKSAIKKSVNEKDLQTNEVALISFSGKVGYDGTILQWKTAAEVRNSHFELQRSINGKNFIPISVINGRGSSNDINNYSFLDDQVSFGTNYYQLKQVNNDGTEFIFNMIAINSFSIDNKHLFKEGPDNLYLPYALYDNKFSGVITKQENNNLKWTGIAYNIEYKVSAEVKKAASAKLLIEFHKL